MAAQGRDRRERSKSARWQGAAGEAAQAFEAPLGWTAGSRRCARDDGQTCIGKSANRRLWRLPGRACDNRSRRRVCTRRRVARALPPAAARPRRRRGAREGRAVQRREGFAARERKPRALQREIAQKKPDRPGSAISSTSSRSRPAAGRQSSTLRRKAARASRPLGVAGARDDGRRPNIFESFFLKKRIDGTVFG
jgi:hypothetical protein